MRVALTILFFSYTLIGHAFDKRCLNTVTLDELIEPRAQSVYDLEDFEAAQRSLEGGLQRIIERELAIANLSRIRMDTLSREETTRRNLPTTIRWRDSGGRLLVKRFIVKADRAKPGEIVTAEEGAELVLPRDGVDIYDTAGNVRAVIEVAYHLHLTPFRNELDGEVAWVVGRVPYVASVTRFEPGAVDLVGVKPSREIEKRRTLERDGHRKSKEERKGIYLSETALELDLGLNPFSIDPIEEGDKIGVELNYDPALRGRFAATQQGAKLLYQVTYRTPTLFDQDRLENLEGYASTVRLAVIGGGFLIFRYSLGGRLLEEELTEGDQKYKIRYLEDGTVLVWSPGSDGRGRELHGGNREPLPLVNQAHPFNPERISKMRTRAQRGEAPIKLRQVDLPNLHPKPAPIFPSRGLTPETRLPHGKP